MISPVEMPVMKYGPPLIQPAYGVPSSPSLFFVAIFRAITNPILIFSSFVVGITLYFLTRKKLFIIIPLILAILNLIYYAI